jgi:ATP-dependent exoDNAse (exonuclease V) alpha subunit
MPPCRRYASTIHKAQGGEFKHITVWLDVPGMEATGYTALSRVARASDYLLGGWLEREHFTPVGM